MKVISLVITLLTVATLSAQQASARLTVSVNVQPSCRINAGPDAGGEMRVSLNCSDADLSRARVGQAQGGTPDVTGTPRPLRGGMVVIPRKALSGAIVQLDF
jgi:hypothetical protein